MRGLALTLGRFPAANQFTYRLYFPIQVPHRVRRCK